MSHNNLPTKPQDSTAGPQSEPGVSQMGRLAKVVGDNIQDIRGNAKWDAIKLVFQHHEKWLPYVFTGWVAITALIGGLIQKIRGVPVDWLIIVVLAVFSVTLPLIAFILIKRQSNALPPSSVANALPLAPSSTELPGDAGGQHSGAWLDTIINYQRKHGLRRYVPVESCEINSVPLLEGKRYLDFTFHVRNFSMFYVSIPMLKYDPVKGSIKFKGEPLSGAAKLVENQVMKLQPAGRNYFTIRQWVDEGEAKDILETLKKVGNVFDFSEAVVYVSAEEFSSDLPAELNLTLGMQNAGLENRIIQLEALHDQHALEFGEWKKYSDIAFRLNLVYGMVLQAEYTIEFPGNTPLPKDVLDYLRAHIDSTIHQCLGPEARDSYFERVPPVPNEEKGQEYWIRSHSSRLKELIEQQHRQLVARKATTQHL